jgi:hypothetical protein
MAAKCLFRGRGRMVPVLLLVCITTMDLQAKSKLGIYGIYMIPRGVDAETYSRAGVGIGVNFIFPLKATNSLLAGVIGFDWVNLLSENIKVKDNFGLNVEQRTTQDYYRIYLGARFGPHGHGFFRPHADLDLAYNFYGIYTDLVVPNEEEPEHPVTQNLSTESHAVFGYDVVMGLDLNLSENVSIDIGAKYLESLALPQQLGGKSVTIYPRYLQIYLEVAVSLSSLGNIVHKGWKTVD